MRKVKESLTLPIITDVAEALETFANEDELGLDTETSGLSYIADEVAVVSLYGIKSARAAILHVQGVMPPALIEFLSSKREFIFHNGGAFDALFLARYGVDLDTPIWFDTIIAEAICLKSARKDLRVSLQATIRRRLGIDLLKEAGGHTWMRGRLTPEQLKYCQEDVMYLKKVKTAQLKDMGPEQLRALALEHKLMPILVKMSLRGLPIDYTRVGEYNRQVLKDQEDAAAFLQNLWGEVNLASPSQIVAAVHTHCGYTLTSTTAESMQAMAAAPGQAGEVARAITLRKDAGRGLLGTALEYQSFDGVLYPRYRQVNRDDGRIEIVEPDLTKIPAEARSLFGGVTDHMVVSVRYLNLWWGIMAYLSRDPGMQEIVGMYLPTAMAEKMWPHMATLLSGMPYENQKSCRALARGALFGHPSAKLAQHLQALGVLEVDAGALNHEFLTAFPNLRRLHKQAEVQALLPAVPITFPTGMRRVVAKAQPWEITSLRAKGAAGAVIKGTLLILQETGLANNLRAIVGEELVFVVPSGIGMEEHWSNRIKQVMADASTKVLGFPLCADIRVGLYWSI
jgi:DNA polymerase I-like protein with 3'-5' exonuclease and polymerase domains